MRTRPTSASLPGGYAEAVADTRGRIRDALPVDDAFAQSLGGQIIAGLGQAAGTLPLYAVPGAGPSVTIGQLFQQGRDDALANGADEATADRAGFANVPAAALDVAADKLIIGKILKPLRGKLTVGQLAASVGVNSAVGGASEAGQQGWQNVVARSLVGFDPDRPIDDGVVNALIVGAAVSGTVTAAGQAVTQAATRATTIDAPGAPPAALGGLSRLLAETESEATPAVGGLTRLLSETEAEATLAADGALTSPPAQLNPAPPASGLARLVAESEANATPAKTEGGLNALLEHVGSEPSGADEAAPRFGSRADTLAEQINARPDDQWRAEIAPDDLTGPDVDLVSQLAEFATLTRKRGVEDFAPFAERLTAAFGDRITPYLRATWETSSGGKTAADLETATAPLQLDGPAKRALSWGKLFWQGAADTLRSAGVRSLATAVDRHIDLAEKNLGKAASLLPSGRIGAEVSNQFEAIMRARENGRAAEAAQLLTAASPQTRELVAAVGKVMDYTGRENRRVGVRVTDAEGNVRPIGFLGDKAFPRVLRDDVAAVLRNPNKDRALWERMKDDLLAGGFIKDRADAVEYLRRSPADDTTSTDYFAGLEKGRGSKPMPESWREYRFQKVVPQYVASWAERAAQIEALGQKIDARDRDAFDVALAATNDDELKRYIERTREHAYGVNRLSQGTRRALSNFTGGTTALLLGNPYSSLRNLIGGVAQTTNQFGVGKALANLHAAWGAIKDVQAAGGLKADLIDLIFTGEESTIGQKAAGLALKINGFSAVEQFVRSHNWLTARAFLRDALASLQKNPQSRASLQALGFFQRHGANAEALQAERMNGPATEAFLRRAVRQAQGGYRYDQCPLFTTGPVGRFLLQFSRWGLMATRFHAEHAIRPALIGDVVTSRNADGRTVSRRVRTLGPLLRSPLVAMVAGTVTYAARDALFGIDRVDADWDEIFATLDEDEQRGLDLALGRMANDIVAGSTFGALTSYADLLARSVDQGQFKSPIDPPSVAIAREVALLGYKADKQGRLSKQDLRQFADRILTANRYGSRLAYRFADAAGVEWSESARYRAEQDKRFATSVGRRFAEETGFAKAGGAPGLLPIGNQSSPIYDDLTDALHSGDAEAVHAVVKDAVANARGNKAYQARLGQLRGEALARQPLAPGGRVGKDAQNAFRSWMGRRLTDEQRERIEDAQRRYFETGVKAGLFADNALDRYTQP